MSSVASFPLRLRILLVVALTAGLLVVADVDPVRAAPRDLRISSVTGGEAEGEIVVTVRRDAADVGVARSLPVQLLTPEKAAGHPATIDLDVSLRATMLDFDRGDVESSLTIAAVDDALFEGPEVIDVGVTVDGAVQRFTLVVVDATVPKLSIRAARSVLDEGDSTTVLVESDIAPVNPVALTVRTLPLSAEHGTDVVELNELVVLEAGTTGSSAVEVITVDDDTPDRYEEVFDAAVWLGTPDEVGAGTPAAAFRRLRIIDDEAYLAFARPSDAPAGEPYRVVVTEPSTGTLEIELPIELLYDEHPYFGIAGEIFVEALPPVDGAPSAELGVDVQVNRAPFDGATTAPVLTATVNADDVDESTPERIRLGLRHELFCDCSWSQAVDDVIEFVIEDAPADPTPFTFSSSPLFGDTISESGRAVFVVRRDAPTTTPAELRVVTVPGSAAADTDYEPVDTSVVLDDSPDSSADIEIEIVDDALVDDLQLETFSVQVFHVDSGRGDATTVPVIEQEFAIEDDEPRFAFERPTFDATRPVAGTTLVEIPVRRPVGDWPLVDPDTGAPQPITLTAGFTDPGQAEAAGVAFRQATLVMLPGRDDASFLVDVSESPTELVEILDIELARTPRFTGPIDVWVDDATELVVAPAVRPGDTVGDDLRSAITAVFESFESWAPRFDLGGGGAAGAAVPDAFIADALPPFTNELPVLDTDLTAALELSTAADTLARFAFDEAADTLDQLLVDLEANGCTVDFVSGGAGGRPAAAPGDIVQATCSVTASSVAPTGESPISDAVSELYQYVIDQPRTFGDLDVSGSLSGSITVGIDTAGPYVAGATGLALDVDASGTLVNSVDPGVVISSSGTATVDLGVGLRLVRETARRIRLADLEQAVVGGLAVSVTGTAAATATMSSGALTLRAEYDAAVSTAPTGAISIDDRTEFTGEVDVDLPEPVGTRTVEVGAVLDGDVLMLSGRLTDVDDETVEIAGFIVDEFVVAATLPARTGPDVAPPSLNGGLRLVVNDGFEPIIVRAEVTIEPGRLRGSASYTDDTADFGVFVLDRPTWTIGVDTAPPPGDARISIGVTADRLVANLGDATVIDATGVSGTIEDSGGYELSVDEGVLGDEDSALRFDIGGLTITDPADDGIILRADLITVPVPLLGDETTATVRDLVVSSDLRIGASTVEVERGPFGDEAIVLAGLIPVDVADVELRFTERDDDGFITDLDAFELEVEAFVRTDAFDEWPFDVVLQLGGEEIRRDTPSEDRRIGFSAAVDSIDPLRVRPIDLGPIGFGLEGVGTPPEPVEDPEVDELLRRIEERDGVLQFVDVERDPPPGLGFTLDAIVTLDGYQDGVLQPGIESLVAVDLGTGLVPEAGVSVIGELVTTPGGDAGFDLQVGFLVDVDLDVDGGDDAGDETATDLLDVDDLEFVFSVRVGAARDDISNPVEFGFLGVRAESVSQSFGDFFDISATEIDLALDVETMFGDDPDAAVITVGGDVADGDSGARLVARDGLGPLAGWGGQIGRFAVTRSGGISPLDGFFVGLVVPGADDPESGLFGLPPWVPLVLDELAVEFGDVAVSDLADGAPLGPDLLDGLRLRVSGGLQASELFPVQATVDDLVVDLGKLVAFDPTDGFDADGFPITNLDGVTFAIQPGIDLGGVSIGGALSFGIADLELEAFDGSTITESVLYGRVAGYLESPVISGGVDLVVSQHGPVLAKVTAPLGVPLGPTGFVLTDVTGAATFGDVQIDVPDLGAPEQLLGALDGSLPTDVEIDATSIAAAIAPSVQRGRPTWDDGFALAVSGTMSNIAAGGLASGDVTLATTFGAPEPGELVPGVQAIGFGELEVFGIPLTESFELTGQVGRAGIMIDVTDVDSPRIDLAFETPSPGSPIGLLFPARATVAAQLDLTGVVPGVEAGLLAAIERAGPAFDDAVRGFVVDNRSSLLAVAFDGASGTPVERITELLERDPTVVLPALTSIIAENFELVGDTLVAIRSGARDALLAVDAEFDPFFSFDGAVQPVLLGIPIGEPETEVTVTIDKDNISFGATGSLIEALKDQVGLYTLSGELAGGLFALATLGATDRLTFDVQIPVPDLTSVLLGGGRIDELDPAVTSTQFAVQIEGDLIVAGMTTSVGGLYSAPDNAAFLDRLVQRRFELPADTPIDPDRVQITRRRDWEALVERGGLLLYGRVQVPRLITDPVGVTQDLPSLPSDPFGLVRWFDDFGDSITATDEPLSATLFVPGLPPLTGRANDDRTAIEEWMDAVSFTGVFDGTARSARGRRDARLLSIPIGRGEMVATTQGLEITAEVPLAGTEATFVARVDERSSFDRRGGIVRARVPMVSVSASTSSDAAIRSALAEIGLPDVWTPSASATLRLRGASPGFDPTDIDGIGRSGGIEATVEVVVGSVLRDAAASIEIRPGPSAGATVPDFVARLDVGSARVPGLVLTDVEAELAKQGPSVSGEISGTVDVTLPGLDMAPRTFSTGFGVGGTFEIDVDARADVFGVATADVSGFVRSDGGYRLDGSFFTIGAVGGVSWFGDVDVTLETGGTVDGAFSGRVTVAGLSADTTGTVTLLGTGQGLVEGSVRVDLDGDGDFGGVFSISGVQLPERADFSFVLGTPLPPDTVAPVFGEVDDLTVTLVDGSSDVPVEFEAPAATDARDGSITAVCTPGSGLIVNPNDLDRTVTCSATDAAGNTATTSFVIDVITEQIEIETQQVQPAIVNVDVPPLEDPPPGTRFTGTVRTFVFSTPQLLGESDVDPDGSFTVRAELPELEPGVHHLALYSDDRFPGRSQTIIPLVINASGALVEVAGERVATDDAGNPPIDLPDAVPAPSVSQPDGVPDRPTGNLPATGGDVFTRMRAATVLLVVGVVLLLSVRRRRSSWTPPIR